MLKPEPRTLTEDLTVSREYSNALFHYLQPSAQKGNSIQFKTSSVNNVMLKSTRVFVYLDHITIVT